MIQSSLEAEHTPQAKSKEVECFKSDVNPVCMVDVTTSTNFAGENAFLGSQLHSSIFQQFRSNNLWKIAAGCERG